MSESTYFIDVNKANELAANALVQALHPTLLTPGQTLPASTSMEIIRQDIHYLNVTLQREFYNLFIPR